MDHHGRVSQSRLGQVAVQDIVAVVSGVDAATGRGNSRSSYQVVARTL